MKRFTEKHYHGIDHYLLCSADCHADMDCVDCPAFENAVERLAAYEDTGLEPEQVEALKRTRWIPCSERLPEDVEDFVLVIVSGRYENLPKHAMIHFENAVEFATFSKKEGWILEIFPEWENPTVTHWQPLPELPKEENDETIDG